MRDVTERTDARLEDSSVECGVAPARMSASRTRIGWDDIRGCSRRNRSPLARRLGVIGVALGLAGGAAGIAAATGAFVPGPHPAFTYGPAEGLVGATGSAPGEVVRYAGPGPDGVTLKVVSASSHPNSGCVGLVILRSTAASSNRTVTGSCTTSGNVNETLPTTSAPSINDYDQVPYTWSGPTGTAYVIWYGMAPSGTRAVGEVSFTQYGPPSRLSPEIPIKNGFYAMAIPKKIGIAVGFYDSAGEVFTTAGGTSGHPSKG